MISFTVQKGLDDIFTIGLKAGGVLQDVSNFTRMTLQAGELLIDSKRHANVFDWTSDGANGQVHCDIARVNGLERGTFTALVVVYDATYTNGKPWAKIRLVVE